MRSAATPDPSLEPTRYGMGRSGHQTMISAALRDVVASEQGAAKEDRPLTVAVLREALREELHQ